MAYHLTIAGAEFDLVRGALSASRKDCFAKWQSTRGDEQLFYSKRVEEYDFLLARFEAVLQADTSQDADEEDGGGTCSACGADLDSPSSAGAEDGLCGECIDGGANV